MTVVMYFAWLWVVQVHLKMQVLQECLVEELHKQNIKSGVQKCTNESALQIIDTI